MTTVSAPLRARLQPRIRLHFPGFDVHRAITDALRQRVLAYAFREEDGRDWYQRFADDVVAAADERRFLPVYRMSDGEFAFAVGRLGNILPLHRLTARQLARRAQRWVTGRLHEHRSTSTGTPGYGAEAYSGAERIALLRPYAADVAEIARRGYLALSLDESPLFADYVPYILDWYDQNGIHLHEGNYQHMYAVYALMHGPDRDRLLRGRTVLVVNHAGEARQAAIAAGLARAGAAATRFIHISRDKALHERIDPSPHVGRVDVALVGAGVGSSNILLQLEPLGVPALDVGWTLDVLAKPEMGWERPFCIPDSLMDLDRIRFIPDSDRKRAVEVLAAGAPA
ncbi:MAG TPA: hypothetical protein VEX86_18210 [Longimicrobium sp.]|nr:hypothetical protein [Longimicrobium sp.]